MSGLSPRTVQLHSSLIRLAKGMLSAWELWLKGNDSKEMKD